MRNERGGVAQEFVDQVIDLAEHRDPRIRDEAQRFLGRMHEGKIEIHISTQVFAPTATTNAREGQASVFIYGNHREFSALSAVLDANDHCDRVSGPSMHPRAFTKRNLLGVID